MILEKWLDQWGISLPAHDAETCRLQVADDPELVLEKIQGGWLMAMRLGSVPSPKASMASAPSQAVALRNARESAEYTNPQGSKPQSSPAPIRLGKVLKGSSRDSKG